MPHLREDDLGGVRAARGPGEEHGAPCPVVRRESLACWGGGGEGGARRLRLAPVPAIAW